MTNPERTAHPDSAPQDDHDTRSDIEQAVQSRADDVENIAGSGDVSPDVPEGAGGENGAGGVVKNQDQNGQ